MTSVLRRQGDLSATERPTVGDLKMSLVGVDHVGWLRCDGREVPIAAFRQLYDVIGNQFGTPVDPANFVLPNPEGRVLGIAGQNPETSLWSIGDVSGEETHTLTLPEIPIHNHDFAGGTSGTNRLNDYGYTDVSGQHVHGVTDPGHTHSYFASNNNNVTRGLPVANQDANSGGGTTITSSSLTGITIDPAGAHSHRVAANGGDQAHNNIQPTLWVGNLFVYSGRLFRDACNGNYFPPQGPPINVN